MRFKEQSHSHLFHKEHRGSWPFAVTSVDLNEWITALADVTDPRRAESYGLIKRK